jgi:hypothetical protein
MKNIINILLYNCDKKYTKNILGLSSVCKDFHKILNNIIITLVKSYYIENKEHNLYKIKFNIIFLYYLSWCDIKDINLLEDIEKNETNKCIKNNLSKKLNSGRFEKYKRLQSPLYYYNLIHIIYNNSNIPENILILIRLSCSCKIINNTLITIFNDYYITFKKTLVINIEHSIHLLVLKHFLIFCEPNYAKSIYELKCNKLLDYDTRRLLDKYLRKKKLICQLRYKHGIIL